MSLRPELPALQPTLGLAMLGLAAGPAALAQGDSTSLALPELDVSTQAPSPYRRDAQPVVRLPTTVAETPQSITVVPREIMDERAASSVREALRNVTGISLSAGEGGFSGDALTLRGFSARGDFFIDGVRDLGQYSRDPFFMDSIEVLKGPSSVAFGRGSTGGIINQTSRLPRAGNFGELNLSAYTPGGFRATSDVNLHAGNVAARVQMMGSHINAAGRDHVYQSRWGVAPSVTWGLGGPTQATISWLHQEEENVPDLGIPFINGRPAPVRRSTFYGLNNQDRERTQTDVVTLRLSHQINDAVTVRNLTRYGAWSRYLNATAPRINATTTTGAAFNAFTTPLDQVLVRREPQVRRGYDSLLLNQTEVVARFRTGFVQHNLLAGVEIARESSEATRYAFAAATNGRPNASLLDPNFYATAPITYGIGSDVKTVANTFAAYAVNQMKFGEMFELMLGGRWDRFDATYNNRSATNPAQRQFSRLDEAFSWRAAAIFKPIPSVRTYFSYGTSFNPSAESLTLAANNAALPPEENVTYELGGSWEVTSGLRLSGSIFRIEKTNARTSDPAGNLTTLDGTARVDGFEIQAAGRITPNWNVLAGFTHLRSEITRSRVPAEVGKEFTNAAPNTASLWTTYDLPYGFQIGGGLSFVDYRYGNNTNTVRVPSYIRYDAALAWAPTEGPLRGIRMQVNALNLANATTYDTVYTAHTIPGTGRTFVFTLGARF
ncbi:TonB-dependent receptor [Sabulicella rubraurantiaca]|uniref:TonB-dependent receptor n=1 Tax=Sabulicella rubraurantiaca TaxID=2811429 RepID=UPI001A9728A0|nr:TonB-dependent siderophore receptor [Sabulicella rubraurantiaca]